MTVMVALLRGINVGGGNPLKMADLREVVAGCGYGDVQTYIASGNVVLSAEDDPAAVARTLQEAIAERTAISPRVTVRTHEEIATIVAANPFTEAAEDVGHLHVTFLGRGAQPDLDRLDPATFAPEAWQVEGDVVFMHLPRGMGRSVLAGELAKALPPAATTRSWRTTTKLLAMAEATAAAAGEATG